MCGTYGVGHGLFGQSGGKCTHGIQACGDLLRIRADGDGINGITVGCSEDGGDGLCLPGCRTSAEDRYRRTPRDDKSKNGYARPRCWILGIAHANALNGGEGDTLRLGSLSLGRNAGGQY